MQLTLRKDVHSRDFGFSVSDGLLEEGVFVNMIRPDGPADQAGLRPFDRLLQVTSSRPPPARALSGLFTVVSAVVGFLNRVLVRQVNHFRTRDLDCGLTAPLILEAGDVLELVISRHPPLTAAADEQQEPPKALLFCSERRVDGVAL